MAGANKTVTLTQPPGSEAREAAAQIGNIVIDLETLRTAIGGSGASNTLVNQLRTYALTRMFSAPAFARSSNFDVANANAIHYTLGGTAKVLAASQTFDTGTAQVIAADKWSAALLSISGSNAPTVTWSATLNAASEAAAIAALPAIPSGHLAVGYITVLTGTGVTWTAGTDALQSGTGGTPATTTNYYNTDQVGAQALGAALTTTTVDQASDLIASTIIDRNTGAAVTGIA